VTFTTSARRISVRETMLNTHRQGGDPRSGMSEPEHPMPDELSPRRLVRRLVELVIVGAVVAVVVSAGPGLGSLRQQLSDASGGWLAVGVASEVLSALSYVVIFRAVFCPRMGWRLSYQIGMAEQGANSVLSVSGAGGLALGVWALRRGGMNAEHIGRRTVAFFFLTSLANVGGVILFALLYAVGVLDHDRNPALTYGFGGAALAVSAIVLALGPLLAGRATVLPASSGSGKVASAVRFVRYFLGQGVRDAMLLLRRRSPGVIVGSLGTMTFDLVVLGVSFKAFGYSPALGVLVLGYLIGQLGGNLPVPGGIGGLDGGLIGTFALYHQPIAATAAAVLVYHAISLWVPALLGSVAFVQLRRTLKHQEQPAAVCAPLAEPIEAVRLPVVSGTSA
jgi:uncharacterized membrane protein YbhN (UPF0104 family)